MYIQNKPRWQIKENQVTNEKLYLNRRKFIKNSSSILGSTALLYNFLSKDLNANQNNENFLKFQINKKYHILSDITPENLSSKYNNFFEFGSTKNIWKEAQKLETKNWKLKITGMVEKPLTFEVDDLIAISVSIKLY